MMQTDAHSSLDQVEFDFGLLDVVGFALGRPHQGELRLFVVSDLVDAGVGIGAG